MFSGSTSTKEIFFFILFYSFSFLCFSISPLKTEQSSKSHIQWFTTNSRWRKWRWGRLDLIYHSFLFVKSSMWSIGFYSSIKFFNWNSTSICLSSFHGEKWMNEQSVFCCCLILAWIKISLDQIAFWMITSLIFKDKVLLLFSQCVTSHWSSAICQSRLSSIVNEQRWWRFD